VKRKDRTARNCLKEAWNEIATRRTATGYEAGRVRRAGRKSQSPYPSRARTVNPAGVRGRLRGLSREIGIVSLGTESAARRPDRGAEASRGYSRTPRRPKARTVPDEGLKDEGEGK